MNGTSEDVEICLCTNEQLEAGESCGDAACPNWTGKPPTDEHLADAVMFMIREDVKRGRVPATVGSLTEVHDHVDGNEYLISALDGYFPRGDESAEVMFSTAETDCANRVSVIVDARLRAGRPCYHGKTTATCQYADHNGEPTVPHAGEFYLLRWDDDENMPYIGERRLRSFTAKHAIAEDGTCFVRIDPTCWERVTEF